MGAGHHFSVEEYACDCYSTPGELDENCRHPTVKRQAYLDELTDLQYKLLFHGEQETERMKKEKAHEKERKQNMQNQF